MKARWVYRLVVLALAGAALLALSRAVDWTATLASLTQLGWLAPIVLVPYLSVLVCDSLGWQATFEKPERMRLGALLRLRVATEAVANSLPAGVAVAETLKAIVLQRRFGLALSEAAANVVVSKFALAIAQSLFLVFGLSVASPTLRRHSQQLIQREGLEYVGLAAALLFFLVACGALLVVARGRLLTRALGQLRRVLPARWQPRLAALESPLEQVDHALAGVGRLPRSQLLRAVALFLCGWTSLGLENWLILRFLSPGLPFTSAISIEAVVSIVRIVFFFIPSALGAQEATYYLLLRVYGVPQPEVVAAAFMITKRAKELAWIGIGYGALWTLNVRVPTVTPGSSSAVVQTAG